MFGTTEPLMMMYIHGQQYFLDMVPHKLFSDEWQNDSNAHSNSEVTTMWHYRNLIIIIIIIIIITQIICSIDFKPHKLNKSLDLAQNNLHNNLS